MNRQEPYRIEAWKLCDVIAHKNEYADVIGGWAISSLLTNSNAVLIGWFNYISSFKF